MVKQDLKVQEAEEFNPEIPNILPHEKIYSIQVGCKLFKISGASLSSDTPSYFSEYFQQQRNSNKVLFIDRNPEIFELIYNHLQGYSINVDNANDYIQLWLDCLYFRMNRLKKYLADEDTFAIIGSQSFKISKSLLINTGNYPNFFTFSYDNLLPDTIRVTREKNMLRPPPIRPATVSSRSPLLFNDLMEILRGNPLVIKSDEHRHLLIRECKYYRFLELEQRIVKHKIINNPFSDNGQDIILNLNDLNARGVINESTKISEQVPVYYKRPYITNEPKRSLIFQLDSNYCEGTNLKKSGVKLIVNKSFNIIMLQLSNGPCFKFRQTFNGIIDEYLIEELESENPYICLYARVKGCKAVINGMEMKHTWIEEILGSISPSYGHDKESDSATLTTKKRKLENSNILGDKIEFKLIKSLWRLTVSDKRPALECVMMEAVTDEMSHTNQVIDFL